MGSRGTSRLILLLVCTRDFSVSSNPFPLHYRTVHTAQNQIVMILLWKQNITTVFLRGGRRRALTLVFRYFLQIFLLNNMGCKHITALYCINYGVGSSRYLLMSRVKITIFTISASRSVRNGRLIWKIVVHQYSFYKWMMINNIK